METNSSEVKNSNGVTFAVVFLGIVTIINIIFLIGSGFRGEKGPVFFGQNVPLVTLIQICILSLICNFYASTKMLWMFLLGGLILAAFPLLLTLNALTASTERQYLPMWLLFSLAIYGASFLGGLLGLLFKRIRK